MTATFEERVAEELDGLWRGCLFMTGCDREGAEALLVRTVREAFHDWSEDREGFGRWMQGRLARGYLEAVGGRAGAASSRTGPGRGASEGGVGSIDLAAICAGAAAIEPRARPALWLVLVRRWRYAEAAEGLGWDEAEVRRMLSHRERFMAAVLETGPDGTAGLAG